MRLHSTLVLLILAYLVTHSIEHSIFGKISNILEIGLISGHIIVDSK